MLHLIAIAITCISVLQPADDKPQPKDELAILAGEWISPLLPIPGVRDGARQRTLEFGLKGKPDAVRLSWRDWCGQTSFAGDTDYTGRVLRVETKDKKRVLILAGPKDTEYRIEFELTENQLKLVGKIKDVTLDDTWKRKLVVKK